MMLVDNIVLVSCGMTWADCCKGLLGKLIFTKPVLKGGELLIVHRHFGDQFYFAASCFEDFPLRLQV